MSLGSISPGDWPFWKGEGTGFFVHSLLIAVMYTLPWVAEAAWHLGSLLTFPMYCRADVWVQAQVKSRPLWLHLPHDVWDADQQR